MFWWITSLAWTLSFLVPQNFHPEAGAHQPKCFLLAWHHCRAGNRVPRMGVHHNLCGTCEAGTLPLSGLLASDPF